MLVLWGCLGKVVTFGEVGGQIEKNSGHFKEKQGNFNGKRKENRRIRFNNTAMGSRKGEGSGAANWGQIGWISWYLGGGKTSIFGHFWRCKTWRFGRLVSTRDAIGPCKVGNVPGKNGCQGRNTFLPNSDKTLEKELKTLDDDNWKCLGGSGIFLPIPSHSTKGLLTH